MLRQLKRQSETVANTVADIAAGVISSWWHEWLAS